LIWVIECIIERMREREKKREGKEGEDRFVSG
jgi:hypothetical protein